MVNFLVWDAGRGVDLGASSWELSSESCKMFKLDEAWMSMLFLTTLACSVVRFSLMILAIFSSLSLPKQLIPSTSSVMVRCSSSSLATMLIVKSQ